MVAVTIPHNGGVNLRAPALALLPLVLVAGCGGSSGKDEAKVPSLTTTAPGATATKAPGGAVVATPSGAATKQPGSNGQVTPAATTGASSGSRSNNQAAPAFATPAGSYTYDMRGTAGAGTQSQKIDTTETLKVDKPVGDRQHVNLGSDQGGGTDTDLLNSTTGTYLVRLKINAGAQTKEFRPAKPVLGHPRPAATGRTWSWTMTSTDGKTHAAYTARITRQETLTIGGTKVTCWVIESTLKLTGDFDYTDERTSWYDSTRLLEPKIHSKVTGTYSGFAFQADVTSTMRSLKPR